MEALVLFSQVHLSKATYRDLLSTYYPATFVDHLAGS